MQQAWERVGEPRCFLLPWLAVGRERGDGALMLQTYRRGNAFPVHRKYKRRQRTASGALLARPFSPLVAPPLPCKQAHLLVQHLGLLVLPGVAVELGQVILAGGDVRVPDIKANLG